MKCKFEEFRSKRFGYDNINMKNIIINMNMNERRKRKKIGIERLKMNESQQLQEDYNRIRIRKRISRNKMIQSAENYHKKNRNKWASTTTNNKNHHKDIFLIQFILLLLLLLSFNLLIKSQKFLLFGSGFVISVVDCGHQFDGDHNNNNGDDQHYHQKFQLPHRKQLQNGPHYFFVHNNEQPMATNYGFDDVVDSDMMLSDQSLKKSLNGGVTGSTIMVVSGQKAILTCPLIDSSSKKLLTSSAAATSSSSSSSASNTLIIPIKWLKENTILPHDHRQHVHANGTLTISSAQKRMDEGSYYCYLTSNEDSVNQKNQKNSKERPIGILKHSATVNLKVMDPPRVGPFEFPSDLQVGMKARAMCSVMQGDPPFRFIWTQDLHRIESDIPTEDTGAIFRTQHFRDYSMLTVDSLTLSHAGNITCIVANDAGKTSQSSMLKVNAPPQWLVEPQDTQVILHQSVRIDCLASGSPKPFTTWKRATGVSPWEYVPIYNAVHYYLHTNGSLTIKSATQSQAGPYICQSTNGYGSDIGKLIHLKVNEPPRFSVQTISQSAQKDKPVRLICPPEGDRPVHMEWFIINGSQQNDADHSRDNHWSKISLNANENTDKFLFEIKEISPKYLNEEVNNNFDENSDSSDPLSLLDVGINGNNNNNNNNENSEINLIVSVLTIRKPTREDSRVFVCKASNEFGWAELKIRLIVKEKPDVPEEFQIMNVTESSAEIRWREQFNGNSPIVNYVVEYRLVVVENGPDSSATSSSSSSSSSTSSTTNIQSVTIPIDRIISSNGSMRTAVVNDLRPNTIYQARISAINRIGQSDFSAWIRFRTDQSAPESPPLDVFATPTGPNSVKITWKSPKKSSWNGEISGYYIGYRADKSDTDLYKTVENSESGNGKHESHITNLHRSTVYKAWVQAFNTRGTGPRSEVVSVQTLADVPPSAPLLRLHSSSSDSITISWSSAAYGSRSSNDLTLYYRAYQPANSDHPLSPGAKVIHNLNSMIPNNWRDISILEPNGRHTVSGLECGRSYEFFATAHNSVGKSEPSAPLVARTRGDAPTPPPRNNILSEVAPYGVVVNLVNWKNNECPINHFSLRIRPKSSNSALTQQQQQWSVLSMQHNPRENFILRKLTPNTAYELEITAHSSAGSTQVIHQFITPNITNDSFLSKVGFDSKISSVAYPMPSSTSEISFSDYEILLPVISSLIVVVVIVAVACFLCSRDHHSLFLQPGLHARQRQQSTSSENKVPFHQQEMSILKELVRSSSVTMGDVNGVVSGPDSMTMIGNHTDDYNCINSEPTSMINTDLNHLNHHHLISPRHNANNQHHQSKKDLVELQSFFNHQSSQVTTTTGGGGCLHHGPNMVGTNVPQQQQQQDTKPQSNRQSNTGNYALPYDVLPPAVCRNDSANVAIYGQRAPLIKTIGQNQVNSQQNQSSQPNQHMVEPLYATAKLIGANFNYCPKIDDVPVQQNMENTTTNNNNNHQNRANYESLVPIICSSSSSETHR